MAARARRISERLERSALLRRMLAAIAVVWRRCRIRRLRSWPAGCSETQIALFSHRWDFRDIFLIP